MHWHKAIVNPARANLMKTGKIHYLALFAQSHCA